MEKPFSNYPDYRYFYQTEQHIDLLEKVESIIKNREGLVFIIGENGIGKTTIARKLEMTLQNTKYHKPLFFTYRYPFRKNVFWKTLAHHLGLREMERDSNNKNNVLSFLQDNHQKYFLDILLDFSNESDLSRYDIDKHLDCLVNTEIKLAEVVIFTPPTWVPDYCNKHYHSCHTFSIDPLSIEEIKKMIEFRLYVSGSPLKFSEATMEYIHEISGGNPRKIVNLCDASLKYLNTTGKLFIDVPDIKLIANVTNIIPE